MKSLMLLLHLCHYLPKAATCSVVHYCSTGICTRPTPASVVNLFTNEYLYLHYSDVDNLCEWVLNAREEAV